MAKKALVFGLGLLGGGVAATNWLIRHGYRVTATDLKDEKTLQPSLKKIKGKVKLALGGHNEALIENNDLIVVNPDVSVENPFLQLAQKLHKEVANEATLFYSHWNKRLAAVTGTRGKTTTVNWLNHFLKSSFKSIVTGNSTSRPLLSVLDKQRKYDWAVTELPSFLLELFDTSPRTPEIAIITNLSQDHLNRHHTLEKYTRIKANIFKKQTARDYLILNVDNEWTDFFLKQNPIGQVQFFSMHPLVGDQEGVFYRDGMVYYQSERRAKEVFNIGNFIKEWGGHNVQNLLASALGAHLAGCTWEKIAKRVKTLSGVAFRQEIIFQDSRLKVVNDTTATSSEGGTAAVKRFGGKDCVLIAGGTDRQLEFEKWVEVVLNFIPPRQIILLQGSATQKMLAHMRGRIKPEQIKETLEECWQAAWQMAKKRMSATILFSPAAKSFEKFKNEYDRGKQFNALVKKSVSPP